MVIVMKSKATQDQINNVEKLLKDLGLGVHISVGSERTIIGVIGDKRKLANTPLEIMPGVERLVPIVEPFKLVGKTFKPESSIINIKGIEVGGRSLAIIAGPCAVESEEQIMETAIFLKSQGVQFLRGGAYKPRTSPYSFQGLGEEGLKLLAQVRKETGLLIVSEVVSHDSLEKAMEYVDVVQIGARNMQNFDLLQRVGRSKMPVILKRGLSSNIEEWLNAAEYIMSEGNYNIILCERGIRTFETATRNTMDINAIPVVKELSHLPIIADPSHGTGNWKYVNATARAFIAAGADGLIIEVHPDPEHAASDGPQSLKPEVFDELMQVLKPIAQAIGRKL